LKGELTTLAADGKESANGGDIITTAQYRAFNLSFEFQPLAALAANKLTRREPSEKLTPVISTQLNGQCVFSTPVIALSLLKRTLRGRVSLRPSSELLGGLHAPPYLP
jgi:hypothetical protein